jgi:hypothetical protein
MMMMMMIVVVHFFHCNQGGYCMRGYIVLLVDVGLSLTDHLLLLLLFD